MQEYNFIVQFFGHSSVGYRIVPDHINTALVAAETPEEIEQIISDHESELAQLNNKCDEFLICDSAAELMADVLRSKGISYQIICGVNDEGDSHSYVRVGNRNYDPTYQLHLFSDKSRKPDLLEAKRICSELGILVTIEDSGEGENDHL